jgi:DNA helicase-2/ATP-dependent DNA helicase PcrA
LRILRKYGERLGYRQGFSVYDEDDCKRLVCQCMDELSIDEKSLAAKGVIGAISSSKDKLITPDDFEVTSDPRTKKIKAVYAEYQKRLMANNAVDFDDIIMKTVELLENDDEVREYYQHKFRYVLVDEYQDTNYAQFILTKLLSDGERNIMVVGDDDQSIYRFRGATIENILNFDRTYPDATVVRLEQNYRSTGNILSAANAIISNNKDRHEKRLWCDKGDGEKIVIKENPDQNYEGKYIIDTIVSSVFKEKRRYSDFAVLYRINAMGRSLQSAFVKSGIPFKVVGDMRFYDRKEIKDMIAYLSMLSNDSDNLRLKRIINEPKRKIGASTVEAVERLSELEGLPMIEIMRRVDEYPVLAKSADKLQSFVKIIEGVKKTDALPSYLINELYQASGYKAMLEAEGFEGQTKMEHVEELISSALEYEKRMEESEQLPTLEGFLEEVSLVSSVDKYDDEADAVVLMTVHASKGLEFPVVFLAGMEDGVFPSEQNRMDSSEMSEERRLAYVAITRAKERLYVTYAKERMLYGRTLYGVLSSFIREELPKELTVFDRPKAAPPRQSYSSYGQRQSTYQSGYVSKEMRRTPDQLTGVNPARKKGAENYGITKFAPGTRVSHHMFGEGEIISAKDMGGDVLYEVAFDNGQTKKLMATFAKLKKI